MNQIVLLFGSNIEKEKNLPKAINLLAEICLVTAVSQVYETVPVGLLDQPHFFNAAVLVKTPLQASEFKQKIIGEIETRLKRVRLADKNAPRTIDVDIVLFNDQVIANGRLQVPDPDLLKFAHVAVPVAELVGRMPHPVTGEPVDAIARRLLDAAAGNGRAPIQRRPDVKLLPPDTLPPPDKGISAPF